MISVQLRIFAIVLYATVITPATPKNRVKMSYTVDKDISRSCSLAIFDFQVSVGTLILSSFIDSCIGDPQCCAEES